MAKGWGCSLLLRCAVPLGRLAGVQLSHADAARKEVRQQSLHPAARTRESEHTESLPSER